MIESKEVTPFRFVAASCAHCRRLVMVPDMPPAPAFEMPRGIIGLAAHVLDYPQWIADRWDREAAPGFRFHRCFGDSPVCQFPDQWGYGGLFDSCLDTLLSRRLEVREWEWN